MSEKIEVRCCILQYIPNAKRREFLNIGIVSFVDNKVDIVLTDQRERIITSFPNVNMESVYDVSSDIKTTMQLSSDYEDCYNRLKEGELGDFSVSQLAGFKVENNIDAYKAIVDEIMNMYVNVGYEYSNSIGKLNIYSPLSYNLDSFIIGTTESLVSLRSAIDKILVNKSGTSHVDLFSSDGEEYRCKIIKISENDIPIMEPMYKNEVIENKFGMLTPEELYLRRTRKNEGKSSEKSLEPK